LGEDIFVLGLLYAAFNLDREKVASILARQFGKKDESVLRNAMLAFDTGYAYQVGDLAKIDDSGIYGYGQLAMMMCAAFGMNSIQSVWKTDGLAFRIGEIVTGVEKVIVS
jgi:hypothetical protein